MPRKAQGSWDAKSSRYYARIGPRSPITGKASSIMLRHADGRPIAFGDTAAVAAAIERVQADRGRVEAVARNGPTVAEVCEQYLRWQVERGAADRTVKNHHEMLVRFCRYDGNGSKPVTAIGPEELFAMKRAGIKQLKNLYASVCACFAWASDPIEGRDPLRILPANPFSRIKRPAAGRRGSEAFVTWAEIRGILRAGRGFARSNNSRDRRHRTTVLSRRLRVLCLHLIAVSGCRPAEAWRLRWSEVDFDRHIIAIDPARDKGRRPGQRPRKPRRFAVPARMIRCLEIVKAWERSNDTWCFVIDKRETEPTLHEWHRWIRCDLKPALGDRMPEGMTGYWLRHSAISEAIQGGASPDLIGDAFGNSGLTIRNVYAHALDQSRKDIMENLAKARRKK
jgi:integrase